MKMMQMPDIAKYQQVKTKLNERQSLIKEFLDRLNAERDSSKFKPLSAARIAMLLAPISTKDLYVFLGSCKDAQSFSKYFWWSVNPKKHQ